MTGFDDISKQLAERRAAGLYRARRTVDSPQGREIVVDGKRLLNFCSNDYLGLAADERVTHALAAAAVEWGAGSGASHLVCGHTRVHEELEEALADFTGRPRCLLFSSGYAANLGAINGLLDSGDRVFEDRLNHASLLDGGRLSGARFRRYQHRDAGDLASKLGKQTDTGGRTLIVTDGTFSMDGDTCNLDELVPLAQEHDAWLMVDEAHSLGVTGRAGCGLVDPARYGTADVQVLIGTLGKAFGTQGGFVAGDEQLIETLIQSARTYIYTTALPAAVAAATLVSLRIAKEEDWRRARLRELITKFRAGATDLGLQLMESMTPIQPVIVGDPDQAVRLSRILEEAGLLITAIRPPTVPTGTARLRVTLTAGHTDNDIEQLLGALAQATRDTGS